MSKRDILSLKSVPQNMHDLWDNESDSAGSQDSDFEGIVWATGKRAEEKNEKLVCPLCTGKRKIFKSQAELTDHKVRVGHPYCKRCDLDFADYAGLEQHISRSNNHIACRLCAKEFKTKEGLLYHYQKSQHGSSSSPGRFRCTGCFEEFTSQPGLVQHLERNLCPSSMRASQVRARIDEAQKATNEAIRKEKEKLKPEKLNEGWEGDELMQSFKHFKIYDPKEEVRKPTEVDMAWYDTNSRLWKCPFNGCGRKFPQLLSFEQHLASDAHNKREWKCQGCKSAFTTSSGIYQHIESGNCKGASNNARMVDLIKETLSTPVNQAGIIGSTATSSRSRRQPASVAPKRHQWEDLTMRGEDETDEPSLSTVF